MLLSKPLSETGRSLFADRARDFGDDGVEGLKHHLDAVADKERESGQRQGDTFELDRLAVGPQHAEEAAENRAEQYPQCSMETISGHQGRSSARAGRGRDRHR